MYNISTIENKKKLIGERIKQERNKMNLTQDEFKEKIHISARQTIARWENGKVLPSLEDMLVMCDLFECELAYLLCEQDCKTKTATDISKETGLSETSINRILSQVISIRPGIVLKDGERETERKTLDNILSWENGEILNLIARYIYPDEMVLPEDRESSEAREDVLCMEQLKFALHTMKLDIKGGAHNG